MKTRGSNPNNHTNDLVAYHSVRKGELSLGKDVYGEPTIIRTGNIIAKVYSPILTDAERERRMEKIKQSCVKLVLSAETVE